MDTSGFLDIFQHPDEIRQFTDISFIICSDSGHWLFLSRIYMKPLFLRLWKLGVKRWTVLLYFWFSGSFHGLPPHTCEPCCLVPGTAWSLLTLNHPQSTDQTSGTAGSDELWFSSSCKTVIKVGVTSVVWSGHFCFEKCLLAPTNEKSIHLTFVLWLYFLRWKSNEIKNLLNSFRKGPENMTSSLPQIVIYHLEWNAEGEDLDPISTHVFGLTGSLHKLGF